MIRSEARRRAPTAQNRCRDNRHSRPRGPRPVALHIESQHRKICLDARAPRGRRRALPTRTTCLAPRRILPPNLYAVPVSPARAIPRIRFSKRATVRVAIFRHPTTPCIGAAQGTSRRRTRRHRSTTTFTRWRPRLPCDRRTCSVTRRQAAAIPPVWSRLRTGTTSNSWRRSRTACRYHHLLSRCIRSSQSTRKSFTGTLLSTLLSTLDHPIRTVPTPPLHRKEGPQGTPARTLLRHPRTNLAITSPTSRRIFWTPTLRHLRRRKLRQGPDPFRPSRRRRRKSPTPSRPVARFRLTGSASIANEYRAVVTLLLMAVHSCRRRRAYTSLDLPSTPPSLSRNLPSLLPRFRPNFSSKTHNRSVQARWIRGTPLDRATLRRLLRRLRLLRAASCRHRHRSVWQRWDRPLVCPCHHHRRRRQALRGMDGSHRESAAVGLGRTCRDLQRTRCTHCGQSRCPLSESEFNRAQSGAGIPTGLQRYAMMRRKLSDAWVFCC